MAILLAARVEGIEPRLLEEIGGNKMFHGKKTMLVSIAALVLLLASPANSFSVKPELLPRNNFCLGRREAGKPTHLPPTPLIPGKEGETQRGHPPAPWQGPCPCTLVEDTFRSPKLSDFGSMFSDTAVPAQKVTLELVGQIGGATDAVHVVGNYAYIGVGQRLVILDVSDPTNPRQVGRTGLLPDIVRDVHVVHNYAYIAAGCAGLRVISVADKANPREVGFLDDPEGCASDVQVLGKYAYIVTGGSLRIISVIDKANPREVGAFHGYTEDAYVVDGYVYVVDGWFGHLWVISLADKANPRAVGFFDIPETERAYGVYVVGDYAYVGTGRDGLRVISVADKANPHQVSSLPDSDGYDVHVAGRYLYLVNR